MRGPRRVTATIEGSGLKDIAEIEVGQARFVATAGHPFWVVNKEGWIDAGSLVAGDSLLTSSASTAPVTKVTTQSLNIRVYNLTVDGLSTFFVSDGDTEVLTHNCQYRRVRPGQQASGELRMDPAELSFVKQVESQRPGLQIYRTNQKAQQGDFVVVDKSNPRSLVGWVIELKSKDGVAHTGEQLKNADRIADELNLGTFEVVTKLSLIHI